MKKIIFFIIVLFFALNSSYGQLKLVIHVYKDITLNGYLSNVDVNLISIDKKKKCFKIKSFGKYEIVIEKPKSIYSIEIEKKHYIPIVIRDIKFSKKSKYNIEVILRKSLSVHDEEYEGPSKVVSVKKIE